MRDDNHADDSGGSERTSIRALLALVLVTIANVRQNSREELARLKRLDGAAHRRLNDRLRPVAFGLLAIAVLFMFSTQPALAWCSEGIGALIFETTEMLWQIVLGLLVIVAIVGLILRAFPLFTGATALGNVMIVGVIVGVIGFVFILTFIDMALGYTGGPGTEEGCSPFL
jgi:hypothetical protein